MYIPLGERIMILRKRRKLSQKELAEMIGVCAVTISNYESGKTKPPLEKLMMLAIALDASVDDLIKITDAGFAEKYRGAEPVESLYPTGKITMK